MTTVCDGSSVTGAVPALPPKFSGFRLPRFTQTPDDFYDWVLPTFETLSEAKAAGFIIRRTFGFGQESGWISLRQMLDGMFDKKTGERINLGTGIKEKKSLLAALRSLEAKGVIKRQRRRSTSRGDEATVYSLNLLYGIPEGGGVSKTPGGGVSDPPRPGGVEDPTSRDTVPSFKDDHLDLAASPRLGEVAPLRALGTDDPAYRAAEALLGKPPSSKPSSIGRKMTETFMLATWVRDYPEAWIFSAMDNALTRDVPKLDYVNGILRKWKTAGACPEAPVTEEFLCFTARAWHSYHMPIAK